MQNFQLHVEITQEIPAVDALQHACTDQGYDVSKQWLKSVMQKGAVWITVQGKTQRLRRAKKVLQPNQTLHLYANQQALADGFELPVLIDDCGDYSLWFKPCGMMSQGSKWGDHSTIARCVELSLMPQRPAFLVHRLDRATQGLILIAHTKQAVRALTALFEQRQIIKKYQAVVEGHFKQSCEYNADIDGRSAYTKASLLAYSKEDNYSLVDVAIGSGRKHQIRRHLSDAQFPLVGDRLYGHANKNCAVDLQLCAYYLKFICPISGEQKTYSINPQLAFTTNE